MQSPMPNRAKVRVLCIRYGLFVCCVHKGVKSCWVAMGGLYGCLRSKDMNAKRNGGGGGSRTIFILKS